jgi:transposase-like protein
VIEARRRHAEGDITVKALAHQMGINTSTLYAVIQRKNWKHV